MRTFYFLFFILILNVQAQEFKKEKLKNIERSSLSYLAETILPSPASKKSIVKNLNQNLKPTLLLDYDNNKMNGAIGGYGIKAINLGAGDYVGASGLGPCVGAIIISPDKKLIYSFHFTATDNIKSTLNKHKFAKKSQVIIFGGDDLPPSRYSLVTLRNYFRDSNYILIGYVNTSGLWTDRHGRFYSRSFETRE